MQISLFGILIGTIYSLVVAGLLLLLWYPLRRWRITWVPFAVVGLGSIVAPWAEEYWVASRFEELCKDAGVHVYRKVEVEGFYDSTMRSGYELIQQKGYRFMEQPARKAGEIEHIERISSEWKVSLLDRPTARYHYKHAYQPTPYQTEEPVGWKLNRAEKQVVDSTSGEVIGRDVHYHRYPSALEGLWVRFFGTGQVICEGSAPRPPELRHLLYHYVLIPTNAN